MATEPTSDEVIVELSLKEALDRANAKEVKVRVALNAANGERNRLQAALDTAIAGSEAYAHSVKERKKEAEKERKKEAEKRKADSIRILLTVIRDYQNKSLPSKA